IVCFDIALDRSRRKYNQKMCSCFNLVEDNLLETPRVDALHIHEYVVAIRPQVKKNRTRNIRSHFSAVADEYSFPFFGHESHSEVYAANLHPSYHVHRTTINQPNAPLFSPLSACVGEGSGVRGTLL